MNDEMVADAIGAENVRRLLDGMIVGEPELGTLAHRVWTRASARGASLEASQ